jgi:putative transposase
LLGLAQMSVAAACRVLKVSRSGYYDWLCRRRQPPQGRAQANAELSAKIRQVHLRRPTYGSPRVHQELLADGHSAGIHRVARLMREQHIRARRGQLKGRPRSAPPARRPEISDLVQRRFHAQAPDQLWCTDVTQIATAQGWLYAAVIIDIYSRRIISWSVSHSPNLELSLTALQQAIKQRKPAPGGIVHSDRGSHYTSAHWLTTLHRAGLSPSIGERGSALDNAAIESWFSSFKQEALYPHPRPATRAEARLLLFQHIHFHNNHRRHSALNYLTPAQYETINPAPPTR